MKNVSHGFANSCICPECKDKAALLGRSRAYDMIVVATLTKHPPVKKYQSKRTNMLHIHQWWKGSSSHTLNVASFVFYSPLHCSCSGNDHMIKDSGTYLLGLFTHPTNQLNYGDVMEGISHEISRCAIPISQDAVPDFWDKVLMQYREWRSLFAPF